jgi:DTW domain-containing protein YfiP
MEKNELERVTQDTIQPIFQVLNGTWRGTEKIFDCNDLLISEKQLKTVYSFKTLILNDETFDYHKVDEYVQDDIVIERNEYAGYYSNRRIWLMDIDNDHTKFTGKPINVDGWIGQILKDPHHRTLISYWELLDDPTSYVYSFTATNEETFTLNISSLWYKDGKLFKRMNVDQVKII